MMTLIGGGQKRVLFMPVAFCLGVLARELGFDDPRAAIDVGAANGA
ncbi:hypothetical protein [Sodalis sp. RH16]